MRRVLFTATLVLALVVAARADDPTSRYVPLFPIATTLPPSGTGVLVQFDIWDSATAGALISSQAHTVDTDAFSNITNDTGFFDLLLGRPGGLKAADFPAGSSRYVDVTQDRISVLAARLPLYAVPFSAGGPRPSGPCVGDGTKRYVDCGNGTVTDTVTGLIWLKQWNCLANNAWVAATQAAAGLQAGACGLTDNSAASDWRLPTKAEWSATVARADALGCRINDTSGPPSLTNDAGTACYTIGPSSFAGVASDAYWSNTPDETLPTYAWEMSLFIGLGGNVAKGNTMRVWPVRGGPR